MIVPKSLLYGFVGLLSGVVITSLYFSQATDVQNNAVPQMNTQMNHSMMENDHKSMTMKEMVESLEGKTGDEFDKAFLTGMIEHHQGAIDMAKLASNAKHQEIKDMASDIISTQDLEILQMKKWQQEWKY